MALLTIGILAIICACVRACPGCCQWSGSEPQTIVCEQVDHDGLVRAIKNLPAATLRLEIHNSNIRTLSHDTFAQTPAGGIQELSLVNCTFETIEEHALRPLKNLKILRIIVSRLHNVPKNLLLDNPNLSELHISKCDIQTVGVITGGANLVFLSLRHNNIRTIREGAFANLHKLEKLDLAGHQLDEIDSGIFNGVEDTLRKLDLSGRRGSRKIPKISDKPFKNLGGVTELKFDYVIDGMFPGLFHGLTSLHVLSIRGNGLEIIPYEIMGPFSNHLDSLILDDNKISELEFRMEYLLLPQLRHLSLVNNIIDKIKLAALHAKTLETLNLNKNMLKTLPKDSVQFFHEEGMRVSMAQNPWDCSCESMGETIEWLKQNNVTMSLICETPKRLKSKDVVELDINEVCYAPDIQNCCMNNITVEAGHNATYVCNVIGSPRPRVTYDVISGNPLPEERLIYSTNRTMVTVQNVNDENNGTFKCVAENKYGNMTSYFNIIISDHEESDHGLGAFKIAWICVGTVLGAFLLIMFTVSFINRRRMRKKTREIILEAVGVEKSGEKY